MPIWENADTKTGAHHLRLFLTVSRGIKSSSVALPSSGLLSGLWNKNFRDRHQWPRQDILEWNIQITVKSTTVLCISHGSTFPKMNDNLMLWSAAWRDLDQLPEMEFPFRCGCWHCWDYPLFLLLCLQPWSYSPSSCHGDLECTYQGWNLSKCRHYTAWKWGWYNSWMGIQYFYGLLKHWGVKQPINQPRLQLTLCQTLNPYGKKPTLGPNNIW